MLVLVLLLLLLSLLVFVVSLSQASTCSGSTMEHYLVRFLKAAGDLVQLLCRFDLVQPDLKLNAAHAGEYPSRVVQTNLWYTLKAR